MERRRQSRRSNLRSLAAGLDEDESIKPSDPVGNSDAAVEIQQVGAASEQYVLTVVYSFAGAGMFIGRSPASNERPPFEYADSESSIGQCAPGRKAGNSSAYDSDTQLFFIGQNVRQRVCFSDSDSLEY